MKKLDIIGTNYFGKYDKSRLSCRGIIIDSNRILLSYYSNINLYSTPGGKLEDNELELECLIREIKEETGKLVTSNECILEIDEYYEDTKYTSKYYVCNIIGEREKHLTNHEIELGLVSRWVDIDYLLNILSKYNDYINIDEKRRGIYEREYKALLEILPLIDRNKSNNSNIKETKLGEGMRIYKEQNSKPSSNNDNICDTHWDGA